MKRAFALILAAMIVSLSILSSYKVEAEAAMLPATGQAIYETFSYIFGHSMGLGTTSDGVGSDVSSDKLNASINALKNYSNLDYSQKQFVNIGLALETYKNVLRTTSDDLDYLMNTFDSVKMKELEERSYSAYGVSYVKSSKERLDEILVDLENMSEEDFLNHLDELYSALNDENFVGDFSDVGMTRKIFDGLNIAGITYSNTYSNTLKPVANSSYNYLDLQSSLYLYEGVNYPFYITTGLSYLTSMNVLERFETTRKVCILPVWNKDAQNMRIFYVSDKSFVLNQIETKNGVDKVLWSVSAIRDTTTGLYYFAGNVGNSEYTYGFNYKQVTGAQSALIQNSFFSYLKALIENGNINQLYDKSKTIAEASPSVKVALDVMDEKATTVEDITAVADAISGIDEDDLGDEVALQKLADAIAGITTTFPDAVVDGTNDVVQAVEGLGSQILTLPKAIWLEFEGVLEAIRTRAITTTKPWEGDNKENSSDFVVLLNGLFLLIMIIMALLKIFIHCLAFIIRIFAIPPSTAFLPDEVILGLDYLNTLEIPGIGLSVYAFMMGLVYIFIVFFAIGILRKNIDHMRVPKSKNGGIH